MTKDRQSAKAMKAERRARRGKRWSRREEMDLARAGGTVGAELIRRTLEALGDLDPSDDWTVVGPSVLPLLKRVRHPFPPDAAPMHLHVPPGIWTGFGIDLGAGLGARLHGSVLALGDRRGDAARDRAREPPPARDRGAAPGRASRGRGHAGHRDPGAGLGLGPVLAPERLGTCSAMSRRTLLTPVRNALVALPERRRRGVRRPRLGDLRRVVPRRARHRSTVLGWRVGDGLRQRAPGARALTGQRRRAAPSSGRGASAARSRDRRAATRRSPRSAGRGRRPAGGRARGRRPSRAPPAAPGPAATRTRAGRRATRSPSATSGRAARSRRRRDAQRGGVARDLRLDARSVPGSATSPPGPPPVDRRSASATRTTRRARRCRPTRSRSSGAHSDGRDDAEAMELARDSAGTRRRGARHGTRARRDRPPGGRGGGAATAPARRGTS